MADTERSQADILTLFADNTSGAISPQDLRDFVVSAQMHGAACWDNAVAQDITASNATGLTHDTYRDTAHKIWCFNHDAVNTVTLRFPMPHRYSTGAVRVQADLIPAATGAGNVVFHTVYAWSRYGYTMPAAASWTSATVTMAVASADTYKTKYKHLVSAAVATGVGASSTLWVTVKRVATAATDTYTTNKTGGDASANLCVESIHAHYPVKRAGTTSEY